jgi:glyoxylase-like metal-dependent hydrolase (beta-lactamase superfamily II)
MKSNDTDTNIIIERFVSRLMSSNMYVISQCKNAFIIDPNISEEALIYIKENSLALDFIILTHEHYDHISGVNWIKEFFNCQVICSKNCSEAIKHPSLNFSKYFNIIMEMLPGNKPEDSIVIDPYSCTADSIFTDEKNIEWNGHNIKLISTPGHSKGSISTVIDEKYLFSGDSLLKDYPAPTNLLGGNPKIYKEYTWRFFRTLPYDKNVYPGHYFDFKLSEKMLPEL